MPDREAAARQSTGQRISRGLWRWGSSQAALLVLLLLLAAMLALSYTFPQASAYVRSDPISYEAWLSSVQVHYRRWTPLLRAVGVFHVRDTPWFRALLALLVLVLLIVIADRVSELVEEWRVPHPESFYAQESKQLRVGLGPDEAADRVSQALVRLGMRVRRVQRAGATHVRAHWRALARVDALLSLAGALCMVAALAANSRWGWSQPGVQVLPSQAVRVGPQGDHRLELAQGQGNAQGVWVDMDATQHVFVDPERGASRGAFRYQLTDQGGPLVSVSASDAKERPLALAEYTLRPELQPELQLAFSAASEESVRLFLLPEAKTVIRLEWRDPQVGSTEPPHFQQWAFEQGAQQMVGSAMITATKGTATTQIGGVTYQWAFWSYAVLDIAYQPGRWLLASGAVLALLGAAAQFVPSRQAWAIVQASEEGSVITLRVQSRFVDPHHEAPFQAILGALALETEHLVWL